MFRGAVDAGVALDELNGMSSSSSSSSDEPNLSTLVISREMYEANYRFSRVQLSAF